MIREIIEKAAREAAEAHMLATINWACVDGEDCAFDQPCKFGHRVETHAVYCHNTDWADAPRKCRYGDNYGNPPHNTCPGFKPNNNKPTEPTP